MEYAILTNIIHQEWAGVSVKQHKALKGLKSQNLRDHMSEAELIFTALAELATRQIAESVQAAGMAENSEAGKKAAAWPKKPGRNSKRKPARGWSRTRIIWPRKWFQAARESDSTISRNFLSLKNRHF